MPQSRRRSRGPAARIELEGLTPFADEQLEASARYESVDFVELDLGGQSAAEASFVGCRFQRCRLDRLAAPRSRLIECLLLDVQATQIEVDQSTWRDVLVDRPRIGALGASGATWSDIRFRGGKIDFVGLGLGRVSDMVLEDCVIGELQLADSEMRRVRFEGCRINVLDVSGAALIDVDLSRSTVSVVRGIESLRGATVSASQLLELAPLLAERLGILVRPD